MEPIREIGAAYPPYARWSNPCPSLFRMKSLRFLFSPGRLNPIRFWMISSHRCCDCRFAQEQAAVQLTADNLQPVGPEATKGCCRTWPARSSVAS